MYSLLFVFFEENSTHNLCMSSVIQIKNWKAMIAMNRRKVVSEAKLSAFGVLKPKALVIAAKGKCIIFISVVEEYTVYFPNGSISNLTLKDIHFVDPEAQTDPHITKTHTPGK